MVDESAPVRNFWQWKYQVRITNNSEHPVQLLTRHIITTDSAGREEQVGPREPGVVGEEPVIPRGFSFRYTAGCQLRAPFGTVHGSYELCVLEPTLTRDGREAFQRTGRCFEASLDRFALTEDGGDAFMPLVVDSPCPAGISSDVDEYEVPHIGNTVTVARTATTSFPE